jgi:hypothetical protein
MSNGEDGDQFFRVILFSVKLIQLGNSCFLYQSYHFSLRAKDLLQVTPPSSLSEQHPPSAPVLSLGSAIGKVIYYI